MYTTVIGVLVKLDEETNGLVLFEALVFRALYRIC